MFRILLVYKLFNVKVFFGLEKVSVIYNVNVFKEW